MSVPRLSSSRASSTGSDFTLDLGSTASTLDLNHALDDNNNEHEELSHHHTEFRRLMSQIDMIPTTTSANVSPAAGNRNNNRHSDSCSPDFGSPTDYLDDGIAPLEIFSARGGEEDEKQQQQQEQELDAAAAAASSPRRSSFCQQPADLVEVAVRRIATANLKKRIATGNLTIDPDEKPKKESSTEDLGWFGSGVFTSMYATENSSQQRRQPRSAFAVTPEESSSSSSDDDEQEEDFAASLCKLDSSIPFVRSFVMSESGVTMLGSNPPSEQRGQMIVAPPPPPASSSTSIPAPPSRRPSVSPPQADNNNINSSALFDALYNSESLARQLIAARAEAKLELLHELALSSAADREEEAAASSAAAARERARLVEDEARLRDLIVESEISQGELLFESMEYSTQLLLTIVLHKKKEALVSASRSSSAASCFMRRRLGNAKQLSEQLSSDSSAETSAKSSVQRDNDDDDEQQEQESTPSGADDSGFLFFSYEKELERQQQQEKENSNSDTNSAASSRPSTVKHPVAEPSQGPPMKFGAGSTAAFLDLKGHHAHSAPDVLAAAPPNTARNHVAPRPNARSWKI